MRGDRPVYGTFLCKNYVFTPHARGSTSLQIRQTILVTVYPACAGIDRYLFLRLSTFPGLPRMRGDRPGMSRQEAYKKLFTPHARGSTFFGSSHKLHKLVYPACAGIDRFLPFFTPKERGLPRMRGDRPGLHAQVLQTVMFTPHARGSTDSHVGTMSKYAVYPACAGIDLWENTKKSKKKRLPRMRGDRPQTVPFRSVQP